jgi:hypothetical protein
LLPLVSMIATSFWNSKWHFYKCKKNMQVGHECWSKLNKEGPIGQRLNRKVSPMNNTMDTHWKGHPNIFYLSYDPCSPRKRKPHLHQRITIFLPHPPLVATYISSR